MKTKVLPIAAMIVLALGTANFTNAAVKDDSNAVVLNDVARISKIEVRGNVEVYVSDGASDKVKVYNRYYSENALVQNQNGTLRISSYKNEKLVVWVTVNDLREISAYDNAEVRSFGKLSEIDLDVDLHDNALATLDLNSFSADIYLSNNAKANISGNATECFMSYGLNNRVNTSQFAAGHFTKKISPVIKSDEDLLAGL